MQCSPHWGCSLRPHPNMLPRAPSTQLAHAPPPPSHNLMHPCGWAAVHYAGVTLV